MSKLVIKKKTNSKGSIKRQTGLLDKVKLAAKTNQSEENFPKFRAGDTVRVHVKIKEGDKERIQPYEGVVIKIGNHPGGKSFNVRKISHGVGVERIFLFTAPKVSKVEIVQVGKVRRAKLYYVRKLEGRAARIERAADQSMVDAKVEKKK
ncbi:MAG: 50S ribosomal protein L19 [Proteobacteria bacterium]|nr:MAG: 50S ribosomal protein L19 [Pseudomonadota bacterium]